MCRVCLLRVAAAYLYRHYSLACILSRPSICSLPLSLSLSLFRHWGARFILTIMVENGRYITQPKLISEEEANRYLVPALLDQARIQNLRPTRKVTPEEIDSFWRDGVVKLEGILPLAAAEFLADCFQDIFKGRGLENPTLGGAARRPVDFTAMAEVVESAGERHRLLADGGYHDDSGVDADARRKDRAGQMASETNVFRWHTDFYRFCSFGPLPEAIAELLGTERLKFHNDHLFFKEKGSLLRTAFHQDKSYFSYGGEQIAVCWVPCDVVTRESGAMCYIRGSHRGPTYAPRNLVVSAPGQTMNDSMPTDVPLVPDIEAHEADFDVVYIEARPGDVIVHHINTLHGAAGNSSATQHRRAASIRYIGDDVVFSPIKVDPRVAVAVNDPMARERIQPRENWSKTADGVALEGGLFPIVWPRQPPAKKGEDDDAGGGLSSRL